MLLHGRKGGRERGREEGGRVAEGERPGGRCHGYACTCRCVHWVRISVYSVGAVCMREDMCCIRYMCVGYEPVSTPLHSFIHTTHLYTRLIPNTHVHVNTMLIPNTHVYTSLVSTPLHVTTMLIHVYTQLLLNRCTRCNTRTCTQCPYATHITLHS